MSRMSGKNLWIDITLSVEVMDFLWGCISEENKKNMSHTLAGNISKSELIKDKDNWFYKKVLKTLIERMFYRDWDNFSKYHIEEERPLPEFEVDTFWVNYQRQYEFNPLHDHAGLYSFVVFMKIPTHWKEQHALPFSADSNTPSASDFQFVWTEKGTETLFKRSFRLSSEDEGRMLFFPANLKHMVYPFYGTEEERVTISGNIDFVIPNKSEIPVGVYEEKENLLKKMKNDVQQVEEELKQIKKEREKEE